MDVIGKVREKLGRLIDKENYPTYNERDHKEFNNLDLDKWEIPELDPPMVYAIMDEVDPKE